MGKKWIYCGLLPIGIILFCGCGQSAKEIAEIVSERDSLKTVVKHQNKRIANLDDVVAIVDATLDSIARSEDALFISNKEEGGVATKADVLENISRLENLINSQKNRIANLESRLADDVEDSQVDNSLQKLVDNLKSQLEKKDRQIAQLKKDLEKKDYDLAQLRLKTEQQSRTIVELDRRATMQQEALKRQDAMLNHCYMVIGTKKELEQKGIVKKGKMVARSALDRSKFSKVDIRKLTQVSFHAKKPRLLTSMPDGSYEITTDGNKNFTINITNPTAFWSVSNYLVIQTD